MGWSLGFDSNWNRDIGYAVPAVCDHPDCSTEIDRGLSHVCGEKAYGGDNGCGLFFCSKHLAYSEILECQACQRCADTLEPFNAKPDVAAWIEWKLTHPSWQAWRDENPEQVAAMRLTHGR